MSTGFMESSYRWLNFVQFCLLPPTCVLCQRPGQYQLDLCRSCQQALPRNPNTCLGCALPLPPAADGLHCGQCQQAAPLVHTTLAAFRYDDPVSQLVGQFKYQRRLVAGRVLGAGLADVVQAHYRHLPWPEVLLPVPLHPHRLRERGYNQSLLIARDLSRALQIPLTINALCRIRPTPPQQGLKADERRRNLQGAFALAPGWNHHWQRVALIDDVVTTMSTVREIARILQLNGGTGLEIHVWCLARA